MKNKVCPQNFKASKFFSLRCQIQSFLVLLSIFPKDVVVASIGYFIHDFKVAWCQCKDGH